jgi:Fur family iron response transcriptional regulator
MEIAYALFFRQEGLGVDQVMTIVNERHSETSTATDYYKLCLFVAAGLIREVIVDPNRVFYEPDTDPHFHLYDVQSRRLTGISSANVRIRGLPEIPEGMVKGAMNVIIVVRPAE